MRRDSSLNVSFLDELATGERERNGSAAIPLPLPETLVTVTSVPEAVMFELNTPMLANSALVPVASRLTFSSVRPSGSDALKPSSRDPGLDCELTDLRPRTATPVKKGVVEPFPLA